LIGYKKEYNCKSLARLSCKAFVQDYSVLSFQENCSTKIPQMVFCGFFFQLQIIPMIKHGKIKKK